MREGSYVVLCIDDDPAVRDWMQMVVGGAGFVVETAASGEEGLKKYKAEKPDLVIVDLMMEEVDAGTNFVKELRALGATPPIYMLSSVGDELSTMTDTAAIGLDGVLQKPLNPDVLLRVLRTKLK